MILLLRVKDSLRKTLHQRCSSDQIHCSLKNTKTKTNTNSSLTCSKDHG
ncbi:hypothetical protein M8C21_020873, partial [Ambrosia artemisiifolia]